MVLSMPRPYKHKKTGVYWYRQRVPKHLAGVATGVAVSVTVAGKTSRPKLGPHITVSLGTKDTATAKLRATEAQAEFDAIWASIGSSSPVTLTNEQAVALAGEVYRDFMMLESDPGKAELWTKVQGENARVLAIGSVANPLTIGQQVIDLVEQRFGPFADLVLERHHLKVHAASRALVLRHTAKALQLAAGTLEKRADGDYGPDEHAKRFPSPSALQPAKSTAKARTVKVADTKTLQGLLAHKHRTQSMKEATFVIYRSYLAKFEAFSGHQVAAQVTKDQVRRWRDHLISQGLATKTINDQYLASLKSTLAHGVKEFDLPFNVAGSIRDEREAPAPKPKGYTRPQAEAILQATFRGSTKNLAIPYQRAIFWVPWILAYTGLRVSEITQLQGRNLLEKDGIPYILITPEDGSTKGGNAWTTGIHPHLIELGLINMFRAVGDGPAFYVPYPVGTDLRALKDHRAKSTGDKIAEWVRNEVGIEAPGNRPNHAWRHLFTTLSRTHKMDKEARDYMMGSRSQTDAREGYGDWEPAVIDAEVRKLPRFSVAETGWRPPVTRVAAEPLKSQKSSRSPGRQRRIR